MDTSRGFSLVELMVTLAVAAILLTLATPNFVRMINNYQVTAQANDLLGSLATARSEAVKRGGAVSLTPSGTGFQGGWCMHTGASCLGTAIIRQHEGLPRLSSSPTMAVVFSGDGSKTSPGGNQTFVITPQDCVTGELRVRTLTLTNIGRSNITSTACP